MSPTSYINTFHLRLRITQPGNRTDRDCLFDFGKIPGAQFDRQRADIFYEPCSTLGAGDRHDVVALSEKPCQRELTRRAVLLGRDRLEAIHQR